MTMLKLNFEQSVEILLVYLTKCVIKKYWYTNVTSMLCLKWIVEWMFTIINILMLYLKILLNDYAF